jgi:hypothetical protein
MAALESNGVGLEEWALAHEALSKLRLKRAALDAEEGRWLLRAFRAATHLHFGYASFGEYIERLFGLNRRTTEEKLRVAGALEELPELAEALRSGRLNWSAVRELSRVAVPATERQWIAVARGATAREVERMVSGLARGDKPTDRRRPECVRHVLRFEVGAETLATFREAMKELQKRSDHRLDDDAALLLMARETLRGPGDAGRASYQVVITQCEDCGRGFQHANGDLVELDPAIIEMCHCDAQEIAVARAHTNAKAQPHAQTHAHAQHHAHGGKADELPRAASAVRRTGEFAGLDAPLRHGVRELGHAGRREGGAAELAQLDAPRRAGVSAGLKRQRSRQDTPPAIRRQVFRRDGGRCVVPGCRNATYVDLHHLELRSEGGGNDPDNLVVLCGARTTARCTAVVCRSTERSRPVSGFATPTARPTASRRRRCWPRQALEHSPDSGTSASPKKRREPASNTRSRTPLRTPPQRPSSALPSLAQAAARPPDSNQ